MTIFLKTHYKKILFVAFALFSFLFVSSFFTKEGSERNTRREMNNSADRSSQSNSIGKIKELTSDKGCTSNPDPVFTHPFTDLSKIASIGPLGTMTGGSPGRSYIQINDALTKEVPVYMPIDATLERLVYARRGGENTPGEYGLQFRVSCEVTFMLDHIDRVTEDIQKLAPEEPALVSNGGTYPLVEMKAGTLLGYSDGTPQAKTWDFFVLNSAKPAKYINPKRWTWDQAITAVCPYDYYTEELKEKHYNLLGLGGGKYPFTKAKDCGSSSKDIAGTISGGWFQGDSTDMKGKNLNIGSHAGVPQVNLREDGNKTINLSDWSSKELPETVRVGEGVCYYDGQNKYVFFKLVSEGKLLFANGAGRCPSTFPESQADVWER